MQLLDAVPHLGAAPTRGGRRTAATADARPQATDGGRASDAVEAPTRVALGRRRGAPSDVAIEYPKRGRVPAFRAVDGIDLQIDPGEVVGLVGESGSGKTTIGRAAVGLLPIAEGTLVVVGVDISRATRRRICAQLRTRASASSSRTRARR